MASLKQRLAVLLLVFLIVAVDFMSAILSFLVDGVFAVILLAVIWPLLFGKNNTK